MWALKYISVTIMVLILTVYTTKSESTTDKNTTPVFANITAPTPLIAKASEQASAPAHVPGMKNVIQVPDNCPPGQKISPDGICREVFYDTDFS